MYSPVSLSIDTCVTCIGFDGLEMVGLRGLLSMPLMKFEKPLFFLPPSLFLEPLPVLSASSEYLWRGLCVPEVSDRGGVAVSIFLPNAAKLALCLSRGVVSLASAV